MYNNPFPPLISSIQYLKFSTTVTIFKSPNAIHFHVKQNQTKNWSNKQNKRTNYKTTKKETHKNNTQTQPTNRIAFVISAGFMPQRTSFSSLVFFFVCFPSSFPLKIKLKKYPGPTKELCTTIILYFLLPFSIPELFLLFLIAKLCWLFLLGTMTWCLFSFRAFKIVLYSLML